MALSDWLGKLEFRFSMAEVDEDQQKINICALYMGQTGEDILRTLPAETTWERAKTALANSIGEGTVQEEAWAMLKNITRDGQDLVDFGSRVKKLAERAYPGQPETIEHHAIDAFVRALDRQLARKVQEQGHATFEQVVAAARRFERLEREYPTVGMESLASVLQEEMRQMRKELKEQRSHEQAVKLAQGPSEAGGAPRRGEEMGARAVPPPMVEQMLPYYPVYPTGPAPPRYPSMPPGRRNPGRYQPPPRMRGRCFVCDEVGHYHYQCPWKQELQRLRTPTQPDSGTPPTPQRPPRPSVDGRLPPGPPTLN